MRPMITEQRQTVLIGNEHFPLDNSERERIRMALKKSPNLGKISQKRRINGKWRVVFAFISHLSRLTFKKNFEPGKNQQLSLIGN